MMNEDKQLKNFYENILKEIRTLNDNKMFTEAFNRIDEELACSYVPVEYEKELQALIVETRIKQYEHNAKQIADYDANKLIQYIMSDLVKNYDAYIFLLDKYGEKLTMNQWQQILTIFISEELTNNFKFLFLVPLLENEQLQNKQIAYFNKSTKKTHTLILSKDLFAPFDKYTVNIFHALDEQFFKEPSKLQLSEHLVDLLIVYFFPDFIPYTENKLAQEIIHYVDGSFLEDFPEETIEPEALKLINQALKEEQEKPKN